MKVESGFDSPARSTMSKSNHVKEADALQKLFEEGRLSRRDLPGLVKYGLNQLSVIYWDVLYAGISAKQLNSECLTMTNPTNCKVCDQEFKYKQTLCLACKAYSFESIGGMVESESILVGDFRLIFFPEFKEANIIQIEDEFKNLSRFSLDEMTPELAKHWAKKLKNYLIFQ